MLKFKKENKLLARNLRRNMTAEEMLLWSFLRKKQLGPSRFQRQKPIGNFIVDFYCAKAKLVVELDGGGHFKDDNKKKDLKRDEFFSSIGIKVLRFTNYEVKNTLNMVLETIYNNI